MPFATLHLVLLVIATENAVGHLRSPRGCWKKCFFAIGRHGRLSLEREFPFPLLPAGENDLTTILEQQSGNAKSGACNWDNACTILEACGYSPSHICSSGNSQRLTRCKFVFKFKHSSSTLQLSSQTVVTTRRQRRRLFYTYIALRAWSTGSLRL
jgi:hypothetical protein